MTKTVFSFLIFILFTISCKEDINIDSPERRVSANFKEIFDGFWQGMNQNYIFWDIEKPSNLWDNIYNKYKDKFYTLNINNPDDLVRGYKYLDTIVQNLSDGHLYITFNHPYLKNDTIKIAKQKDNINFITDEQLFYKNPNLYFDKHNVLYATDNNNNLRVLFATINENTLYFHCNYFFP